MRERKPRNPAMTLILSGLMIVVGIMMIVRTVVSGGNFVATGLILGVLFIAAGAGRLYLQRRLMRESEHRRRD